MVKQGSKWVAIDRKEFIVLERIELEGNVWIHYRDNKGQEYSCYEDAFKLRFTESLSEQR